MRPPTARTALFVTFVGATCALAGLAPVVALRWIGHGALLGPTPALFWIMSLGLFLAEVRPPSWLTFGSAPVSVSWVFAFSLVLMGAPAGALLVIAISAGVNVVISRGTFAQLVFNVAQVVVSLAAGIAVLHVSGWDTDLLPGQAPRDVRWMFAVLVSAAVIYVVNALLVAVAVALRHRRSFRGTLVEGLRVNLAGDGVLLALAPVSVVVGQRGLVLLPFTALTAFGVFGLARLALNREHQATHDPLTDLANRRGFEEQFDLLLDRKSDQLLAVIVIDLDRFKPINDRYGHAVGDAVLGQVADRIAAISPPGSVTARLGGDEFAMAWLCGSAPQARRVGAEIIDALAAPVEVDEWSFEVRGSIGVSIGAGDAATAVAEADAAMYRAKIEGLGVLVFDGQQVPAEVSAAATRRVEEAIARADLAVRFEAIVRTGDGALAGVGATAGHLDTTGTWAALSHVDDERLTARVNEHTLERSLEMMTTPLHGAPWVSAPASVVDLGDLSLPDRLHRGLSETGVGPSGLRLRVPCRDLADRLDVRSVCAQLDDLGISIIAEGLDRDSSLGPLTMPAVRAVSLSPTLVRSLATGHEGPAMATALIGVAVGLGLEVVATGVEDLATWIAAGAAGCTHAAGPLIAEPLPAAELSRSAVSDFLRPTRRTPAGAPA